MAQVLASKFIYPDTDIEAALKPFRGLSLQLAFFKHSDFHNFDHKKIKDILKKYEITVPTVHAPTTDVFDPDFIPILQKIKGEYDVRIITIHPQRGDRTTALKRLIFLKPEIERLGIVLAYENFPKKQQKWINSPIEMYDIFNKDYLRMTYDVSHRDMGYDIVKELKDMMDGIEVIHLSDIKVDREEVKEHQPIGTGVLPINEIIKTIKKKKFHGFVVLEYMPEFDEQLIKDVAEVKSQLE